VRSPQQAYSPLPQEEGCRARSPGCLVKPSVRIYCRTEGTSFMVCSHCYAVWQARAGAQPQLLSDRCPGCADSALGTPLLADGPARPAHPPVQLSGMAAQAINAAMHAEGLLADVRGQVLARLHRDAPWLAYAVPPGLPAGHAGVSSQIEAGV
jgi:hypothetical protein